VSTELAVVAGRFEYVRELARGAVGRVVLVRDRVASAPRALKVVAPEAWESLAWEEELLGSVAHPSLARVFELLRLEAPVGAPFHLAAGTGVLVEEHVDGSPADRLVDSEDVPARWVLASRIAHEVGRALLALHMRGILHGDVKPANILVPRSGPAVLIDLGLGGPALRDGRVRGTPGYLAPEAWLGERSPATDVFALGATLFRLLGGALEARASTPLVPERLRAEDLPAEVPAALREVVLRATQDAPEARATLRDLLLRIAAASEELGAPLAGDFADPSGAERALMAEHAPLVGRSAEVARGVEALLAGHRLEVVGPPGAGRSRVAREVIRRFQAQSPRAPTVVRSGDPLDGLSAVVMRVEAELSERVVRAAEVAGCALWLVAEGESSRWPESEVLALGPLEDDALGDLAERLGVSLAEARRSSGGLPGTLVRLAALAWRAGRDPGEGALGLEAAEAAVPTSAKELAQRLAVAGGALPRRAIPEAGEARTLRGLGLASVGEDGWLALRPDVVARVWEATAVSERVALGERLRDVSGDAGAFAALAAGDGRKITERVVAALDAGDLPRAERVASLAYARSASAAHGDLLAEVYRAAGRYEDALAVEMAPTLRAEILRRAGRRDEARTLLETLPTDEARVTRAWLALGEGALADAEELAAGDAPEAVEVRAWVQLMRGEDGAVKLLEAALPRANPRTRARLFSSLGSALKARGEHDAAARSYRAALELADSLAERHLAAGAAANLGAVHLDVGELGPGIERTREAARRLVALGRDRDAARAMHNLAHAALWIGDLPMVRPLVKHAEAAAGRAGDAEARAWVALARAELRAREGKLEKARAALEEALEHAPESARPRIAARGTLLFAATDRATMGEGGGFDGDLARARVALARGELSELPALQPASWEERLEVALLAVDFAESRGAPAEAAASEARALVDLAARSLDPSQRAGLLRRPRLQRILAARPATRERRSRDASRWVRLAELATKLTAERRLTRLREDVVDAALALVGGERGCLVERREDGSFRVRALRGAEDAVVSRSVVARALDGLEVVATVDAQGDERLRGVESVHALSLRSVLCAPVQRGVTALYVDDRLRPAAFDDEDRALLVRLAELAAIALDGARRLRAERAAVRRLERAQRQLADRVEAQRAELDSLKRIPDDVIAVSPAMRETVELASRVAASTVPVLVTGESGAGKERIARLVHEKSARAGGPFVAESCGAVPESLLESTLFGHERGAFTGAARRRIGLFEAADGGTLFLDEVGEMSPAMQAKLLRVVQEGEVRRVGGQRVRTVDVRLVTATHRDLRQMVDEGTFREDLFYRLAVVNLEVPPLRKRTEDVPRLVEALLARHAERRVRATPAALSALAAYRWPGNVRELENELRRALLTCDEVLDASHLSERVAPGDPAPASLDLKGEIADLERRLITAALERTEGNQTHAAKLLGVSRYGLQKMIKRLEITV